MSADLSDIEKGIQEALDDVRQRADLNSWSNTNWTREGKGALTRLGRKLGYKRYASSVETKDRGNGCST
jgi:hypothetical protein